MDLRILANKFWIEATGIILSFTAGVLAACTSAAEGRTEKIAACIFSMGIFGAILRSRFDVLKELGEHKRAIRITVEAIELYARASEAISILDSSSMRDRARAELSRSFSEIQELSEGRMILDSSESINYQAAIVRSAQAKIFAIHVVKDDRDLVKWLKKDGEFNVLKQAYSETTERLKSGAMVRVFVVGSELIKNADCMKHLRQVKDISERSLGFKTSIVLRESDVLDKQIYASLLFIDRSNLVTVRIEPGNERAFKIVAYVGKGLDAVLSRDEFAVWEALQREPDMSEECFGT